MRWREIKATRVLQTRWRFSNDFGDFKENERINTEVRFNWNISHMTSEKVLRVSQLDATELDDELTEILQQQFVNLFRSLPSISWIARIKPELRAFVRVLIWTWSVRKTGSTFGQTMMQLKYSQTAEGDHALVLWHKWLLLGATVCGEWLFDRLEDILPTFLSWTTVRSETVLLYFNSVQQMANLLNFCLFLLKGEFPTLKERFFFLYMRPKGRQMLRKLNYEYMNREIIWYGFGEFLFFVLPHLNLFAVKNWLNRLVPPGSDRHHVPPSANERTCAVCKALPVMPHTSNCGHTYCYYCIAANVAADSQYPCGICGQVAAPFRRAVLSL